MPNSSQVLSNRRELLASSFKRLFTVAGIKALLKHPGAPLKITKALISGVWNQPKHTIQEHEQALAALTRLVKRLGPFTHSQSISDAMGDVSSDPDCIELASLLTMHGSDKATKHNYHLVYGAILRHHRNDPLRILEIGLGTNYTDIPSNMGSSGRPGASLRAFRDWASQAMVIGADVDRRILFSEERITTHFVDQTAPDTLANLANSLEPASFDLVIDDGLHTPEANINVVTELLPLVKPGGSMVIEDIKPYWLPYWQTVFALLGRAYACSFIQTRASCMCVIRHVG